MIENTIGDGIRYGVSVKYFREEDPLGTAGALFRMGLQEDFLFLSGDLVFSFELNAMQEFHRTHGALATLFAHPSSHPADSASL